jgi:hypothetical protein
MLLPRIASACPPAAPSVYETMGRTLCFSALTRNGTLRLRSTLLLTVPAVGSHPNW